MRGIGVATEAAAAAFNVPLIVNGTSLRTEEYVSPEFFLPGELGFFQNVLRGENLLQEAKPLLYTRNWKRTLAYYFFWWTKIERVFYGAAINLPDYLDWDYEEIFKVIKSELGWKAHREDAEHTDCMVDNIVNHIRLNKFPALKPELLRYSKLVTAGIMAKQEASDKIRDAELIQEAPRNLKWFLDTLDISEQEFEKVLSEPMRHMRYLPKPGKLWNACRAAKRKLFSLIPKR